MKIHFIAIGGSIMHALAIDLKNQGHIVSGSDDVIYEPSKSNLLNAGILPSEEGWFVDKITSDIDFIILGMHAKKDNPELLAAQYKKIKIFSFPEFVSIKSKKKFKVVIAGSHGKTTITSMIMHVLKQNNILFDYLVGAKINGFDNMVSLSNNKIMIIEGDEYLSSKIDMKPKFLHYTADLLIISGISWDHINIYPTFSSYCNIFEDLLKKTPKKSTVFYCKNDVGLKKIVKKHFSNSQGYSLPKYDIVNGKCFIKNKNKIFELSVFGDHNLYNLQAASLVCEKLGLERQVFLKSITSFLGADKRLRLLGSLVKKNNVYLDFAHSPSKVAASVQAVKDLYPDRLLISCLELHTFSSLNLDFIAEYANSFKFSDHVCIYYSPEELKRKNLKFFSKKDLSSLINHEKLTVFDRSDELEKFIIKENWNNKNLLLMSSGNFNGLNIKKLMQ